MRNKSLEFRNFFRVIEKDFTILLLNTLGTTLRVGEVFLYGTLLRVERLGNT